MSKEYYEITLAGVKRNLPLFEVAPGLKIAVLNILGDTELVEACADELAKRLESVDYDVMVTVESKSIPIIYALAVRTKKPYVVCRKNYKSYMGNAIRSTSNSITTQSDQTIILDEKDIDLVKGKKVLLVDDVISTGGTLIALINALREMGAEIVDILIPIDKSNGSETVLKATGIRVKTLAKVSVVDGRVVCVTD